MSNFLNINDLKYQKFWSKDKIKYVKSHYKSKLQKNISNI